MNIPEWIKPAAWGGAGGAVVILIVGFSAGWLTTEGAATERAEAEAEKAVVSALTPICVAQFRTASVEKETTQLAALEEASSWEQEDYVAEHGWATMPGAEEPNDEVAEACAEALLKASETSEG